MLKSKEVETRLFKVYFFINLFFVFNFVIFIYQPRWGFGLFLCLFVLFILISSVPSKWYKKIVFLVVLPLSICFLAVYIPNERYIQYDIYSKTNGLKTIFSSNQNFICLEIEKDINDPAFQKYDKKFLRAIIEQYHLAKDKELVKPYGIQWYPTLGYNLDYLLFGPREKILESYFGRDDKKYNGFFRYYILRSIVKHPVMFFSKVFKELSLFYFDGEKYPLIRPALIDNWHYSETILEFFKTLFTTKMFLDYYNNIKYIQKFKIDMSFYPITLPNLFLQFYSIVYSWVLVLFLLALIVSYFLIRKKLFHFGLNGLFLYLITFFILLTLAASHTVNARYIADLFILILFGGSFGISYVVLSLWNFFSYFFRNGS